MNTYKTSDIGIAAYIMMKGLRLAEAKRASTGRFSFIFDDSCMVLTLFIILDDSHSQQ